MENNNYNQQPRFISDPDFAQVEQNLAEIQHSVEAASTGTVVADMTRPWPTYDPRWPYQVLCHQSASLQPDGELEYIGSQIVGRHATASAACKQARSYNAAAREMGLINLRYEVNLVVEDAATLKEAQF